jgi:hypothetical protein
MDMFCDRSKKEAQRNYINRAFSKKEALERILRAFEFGVIS